MYAEQMLKCTGCKKPKSESDFYNYKHDKRCKYCVSKIRKEKYKREAEEIKATRRTYAKNNPNKIKDTKLKQDHGMTLIEYNQKLAEQNGKCAICKKPETAVRMGKLLMLAVDHRHSDNKNRGLLCMKCNRALGLLDESLETIENMSDYLKKHLK